MPEAKFKTFFQQIYAIGWGLVIIIKGDSSVKTIRFNETFEAFRNPMVGFRPTRHMDQGSFDYYEYASTYKHYIKYTELENNAGDSVLKIIDWSNKAWAGIENRNIKVIPRVFILFPNVTECWADGIPHDGTPGQWTTDTLKNRLVAITEKLGQAWDDDPRVAAVEMGLWGKWGEHHICPDALPNGESRISEDFQQALGDAFSRAFKNKKVMIRYPDTFTGYNFGILWDSFALPDDFSSGYGIIERNCWQTQMISGEVAYDWGDQALLGGSPDGTLSSDYNTDHVIHWIRLTHTSNLGWISDYTPDGGRISENAARVQKELGYRFFVNSATFLPRVESGSTMTISFNVSNIGNGPFYYNWPVKAVLLRQDKTLAWSAPFAVDIRNWLPGNSYDVCGSFNIPIGMLSGTYILALSVNDPSGDLPSLRFANSNYFTGGWMPVGKVGVGCNASDQELGAFDILKEDNTLYYKINNEKTRNP